MHLLIWSQGLMFYKMVIRVAVLTSIPLQQIPYIFYHPFYQMEETLLPKFSLLFTLYVTWTAGSGTRCLLLFSGQICMSFGLFVRFCLQVWLFVFSLCIFPIPSFGCGLKDLFPAAHKVSKLSISITFWWCHKWKGRGNAWALPAVQLWIRQWHLGGMPD